MSDDHRMVLELRIVFTGEVFRITGRGEVRTAVVESCPPDATWSQVWPMLHKSICAHGQIVALERFAHLGNDHIRIGDSVGLLIRKTVLP